MSRWTEHTKKKTIFHVIELISFDLFFSFLHELFECFRCTWIFSRHRIDLLHSTHSQPPAGPRYGKNKTYWERNEICRSATMAWVKKAHAEELGDLFCINRIRLCEPREWAKKKKGAVKRTRLFSQYIKYISSNKRQTVKWTVIAVERDQIRTVHTHLHATGHIFLELRAQTFHHDGHRSLSHSPLTDNLPVCLLIYSVLCPKFSYSKNFPAFVTISKIISSLFSLL